MLLQITLCYDKEIKPFTAKTKQDQTRNIRQRTGY